MLKRFSVKNYRGFRDELVWDLSQPGKYTFNEYAVKDGILKNGIIYGTNGSGKSNLALAIMDIAQHIEGGDRIPKYNDNYIYAAAKEGDVVEFCYTFQFGDEELTYRYSKGQEGKLHSEELLVNGVKTLAKSPKEVFFSTEFSVTEDAQKRIIESSNNLSILNYSFSGFPLEEGHYLINLVSFVQGIRSQDFVYTQESKNQAQIIAMVEHFVIERNLIQPFSYFLQNSSGQEFTFVEPKEDDKYLYCLIEGKPVLWRSIISQGTKALVSVFMQYVFLSNEKYSFLILDEFDAYYHHELAYNVCKVLFANETTQVFMTTHHTSLMTNNLLRPDCYFVIDGKTIKPIKELTHQELREAHNLEKMYRGKAFSR